MNISVFSIYEDPSVVHRVLLVLIKGTVIRETKTLRDHFIPSWMAIFFKNARGVRS